MINIYIRHPECLIYVVCISKIMIYNQLNGGTSFILTQVTWANCPVIPWEGFGWDDSIPSCHPDNGDRDNPINYPATGYDYIHGCGELISLVDNLTPEIGWKVIGMTDDYKWVCIPSWYVFPKKEVPKPQVGKMVALLMVGVLSVWGANNMLFSNGEVTKPQSTYQSK